MDQLAEELTVSRETIRRDLVGLDELGRIQKFHGGAKLRSIAATEMGGEGPFAARMAENLPAKRQIAKAAASLLSPGDSLFIDTGTTTVLFAEAIAGLSGLTVITNSIRIASLVSAGGENKVFLIGGAFSMDASETVGSLAVEQIGRFRARHAFLTVGAIDGTGLLDFDEAETQIARAMIERVETVTVLADASKFNKRGIFEVTGWDQIGRLVTDTEPPPNITQAIEAAGASSIITTRY
ncbi:DeoR/GlpR family DNA-binding transcription regulator [Sinorhizobium sp. RAC02]|uniref:DeoR/GlpR family DNA-binding transcription regulator n=1 Tax=Sinorhizobium sp. RAC02 TaxID=1842534 RepID=UPI0008553579|nr:DeoR/GlpR family DNA-binding transcription regulator [Sinorhizobium sp. RAC02]AOF93439.1 deoR-like helix-turn-helix domain protein [Sinorhizobium sp. RAC02]